MHLRNVILVALVLAVAAFAQNPITADSPFQIGYFANLNVSSNQYINITNTGANGAPLLGPGFGAQAGNICVNLYAFNPDEEMISCCSCHVTPDGMKTLTVGPDILANVENNRPGVVPSAIVVKLVATLAGTGGTGGTAACNQSAATITTATIVSGLVAWRTSLHANPTDATEWEVTDSAFVPATLSAGETASLAGRCAAILGNATGYGVCSSCRVGALGAPRM